MQIHTDSPRLFIGLAVATLLAIGAAHFVPVSPYLAPVLNAGHGIAFLVITLLFYVVARRWLDWPRNRALLGAGLAAAGLAFTLEAVQVFTPRDADLGDLLRDFSGVALAGFYIRWRWHGVALAATPRWVLLTVVAACLIIAQPVVLSGLGFVARESRQPVLLSFNTVLERLDYRLLNARGRIEQARTRWPLLDAHALRLQTRSRRWSGLDIEHLAFGWGDYRCLELVIGVEEPDAVELTMVVTDRPRARTDRERFRRRIDLTPGHYAIRIPTAELATEDGKRLNLARLYGMRFTFSHDEPIGVIWIDKLQMHNAGCSSERLAN